MNTFMRAIGVAAGVVLAVGTSITAGAATASTRLSLEGTTSLVIVKNDSLCASGAGDLCGVMPLDGLGTADWSYQFGPTFEPNGDCFDVDGIFSLTLQSDGSTITGPLTGLFCPRASSVGHEHAGHVSYGNPWIEDDTIALGDGTGRFAGRSGAATFHQFAAGARFTGALQGGLT